MTMRTCLVPPLLSAAAALGSQSHPSSASATGVPPMITKDAPPEERLLGTGNVRKFHVLSSEEIFHLITDLADRYPQFATLTDAQTRFGLPAAGSEADCPYDRATGLGAGCRNYILSIEDKAVHPEGSASAAALPEVFLSGCLHGNERVGPSSVTEAASLLLEAAACVALPTDPADATSVADAIACRRDLDERGIGEAHRRWLARLVSTRRIVIMPTANALGYYQNRREEGGIDPNRDFPFDIEPNDSDKCMQTIAGRSINEVFREHLFQLSITFHAGMEAITYEWGAPTYLKYMSPDDEAQSQIAQGYKRFAGKFAGTPDYKVGTMNDVVYYVRGGMEDWAYGGSWDPDRVVQCTPNTFGGYPLENTAYNDSTLRMFNVLVEASDHKTPPADKTGTTEQLLISNGTGNGHISRNIRIALMAIELVEPYVSILGADGIALEDDIVPSKERSNRQCMKDKAMLIPSNKKKIEIEWTVGGGFTVDETRIIHGRWEDMPASIDGSSQLTDEDMAKLDGKINTVDATVGGGTTQWHQVGAQPSSGAFPTIGPVFQASIDITSYGPGDKIAVFALARLDSSWSKQPNSIKPEGPPLSHAVNARTNPEWHHESAGKIIQGRILWYSIPLTLVFADDANGSDGSIDLSSRLKPPKIDNGSQIGGDIGVNSGSSGASSGNSGSSGLTGHLMVTVAACSILIVFACVVLARRRRGRVVYSRAMMANLDEFSEDLTFEEEDAFANTAGSYHDQRPDASIEMASRRGDADDDEEEAGGRAFSIE